LHDEHHPSGAQAPDLRCPSKRIKPTGRTHDPTPARAHGIAQTRPTRQVPVQADRAHQDTNATARTPYNHHKIQPAHYQQSNHDHARQQAPAEHTFAQPKTRPILRRARCSTNRTNHTNKAIHTLPTYGYHA
ncbi:hypothetical protein ACFQ8A_40810, partial [Streptomyces erythrochromogenes]